MQQNKQRELETHFSFKLSKGYDFSTWVKTLLTGTKVKIKLLNSLRRKGTELSQTTEGIEKQLFQAFVGWTCEIIYWQRSQDIRRPDSAGSW